MGAPHHLDGPQAPRAADRGPRQATVAVVAVQRRETIDQHLNSPFARGCAPPTPVTGSCERPGRGAKDESSGRSEPPPGKDIRLQEGPETKLGSTSRHRKNVVYDGPKYMHISRGEGWWTSS